MWIIILLLVFGIQVSKSKNPQVRKKKGKNNSLKQITNDIKAGPKSAFALRSKTWHIFPANCSIQGHNKISPGHWVRESWQQAFAADMGLWFHPLLPKITLFFIFKKKNMRCFHKKMIKVMKQDTKITAQKFCLFGNNWI